MLDNITIVEFLNNINNTPVGEISPDKFKILIHLIEKKIVFHNEHYKVYTVVYGSGFLNKRLNKFLEVSNFYTGN